MYRQSSYTISLPILRLFSIQENTAGSPMHVDGGMQSPCQKREGSPPEVDTPIKRSRSMEGSQVN